MGALVGMVRLLVVFAVACGGAAISQHGKSVDSVIMKVVEMLESNKVKVAKDLASEEKEVTAYAEFCDSEATTKAYAIKDSERTINDLTAVIEDSEAQEKAVDSEIAALGTELAGKEKDMAATEADRKVEKGDFESTEKTLISSVEQLEKALAEFKHEEASFLQKKGRGIDRKKRAQAITKILGSVISAAWVSRESSKALKGFIQEEQAAGEGDDLKLKAKEPEGGASSGVVQTLEDMKTKAEETLSGTRMDEMKAQHSFKMVVQSITDAMNIAKDKLSDAKQKKESVSEATGKATSELSAAKKTKAADVMYLKSLKTDCATAEEEWADTQKDAKAEMAALDKAKEILTAKVKVLVQQDNDYLQSQDNSADQTPVRRQLVQRLKTLSHQFKSYALAEMASAAAADPFEKVKGIIEDMIAKLVAQAAEEATQKSFCDEEKAKSGKEKEEGSMKVDMLMNRVDTAKSSRAALLAKVKELEAEVAAMDKAAAEATAIRNDEHASYLLASKDFKDAADAVTEAIGVLKEYYSPALLQVRYGGKGDGAGATIISILENSGEEFTKMYMMAETDEKEAVDAYTKLMDEGKISKASTVAEIKGAESEVKTLDVAIAQSTEDYKMASKELDAVMEYIEKLKPQCEAKVITYAEKKAKREQEIEGLKEALAILDAPALVQTRKS